MIKLKVHPLSLEKVMSKGLDIILEKIEANPDHATMVERFLQLAAELPDGAEKVDAVLRLARALKNKYPDDALQLVRQVYDQRESSWVSNAAAFEIKALHHLREVFIAMGHPAKGEVLALEIRKIEDGITSRRRAAGRAAQRTDETRASRPPTPKVAGSPVPPPEAAAAPAPPIPKGLAPRSRKPKLPQKPPARAVKETTRTLIKENAPSPAPEPAALPEPPTQVGVSIPPPQVSDQTRIEDLQFKDIKKLLQFFDQYFKKPSDETNAAHDIPPPQAEVVVPPVPDEPAVSHDLNEAGSLPTFWRPLHEFLVGQSGKGSPRERLLYLYRALSWPVPEHRFLQTLERFRRGDMDVETESGREELAYCLWVDWGVEAAQRIMIAGHLEDGMLTFWTYTLDRMMVQGRHRMALALIRATLQDSFGSDWGSEAYTRLLRIWPALEVDGFNWKERDGVGELVARLKVRERPHLTRILA